MSRSSLLKGSLSKFKRMTLSVLKRLIMITTTILLLILIRYAGWKGVMCFVLGMIMMAYLILSENMMLKGVIQYAENKK